MPLLDPPAEWPSAMEHAAMKGQENKTMDEEAKGAAPRSKMRPQARLRQLVTTAEQLESKLWAARMGLFGWW